MWWAPAVIATTLETPETSTGTLLLAQDPFPSAPYSLRPQHSTRPAAVSAQVWLKPVVIAVITGVEWAVVPGDADAAAPGDVVNPNARMPPRSATPVSRNPIAVPLQGALAGRSRQWLGAVPAAGVWTACHRLPRCTQDA